LRRSCAASILTVLFPMTGDLLAMSVMATSSTDVMLLTNIVFFFLTIHWGWLLAAVNNLAVVTILATAALPRCPPTTPTTAA